MLLPVNDDSCDLLVHENEDGAKQCWDEGDEDCPPWVWSQRADDPATVISGRLKRVRKSEKYRGSW